MKHCAENLMLAPPHPQEGTICSEANHPGFHGASLRPACSRRGDNRIRHFAGVGGTNNALDLNEDAEIMTADSKAGLPMRVFRQIKLQLLAATVVSKGQDRPRSANRRWRRE